MYSLYFKVDLRLNEEKNMEILNTQRLQHIFIHRKINFFLDNKLHKIKENIYSFETMQV